VPFSHLGPVDFSVVARRFLSLSHWTLCSPLPPLWVLLSTIFVLQFFRTLCSPSLYGFSRTLFVLFRTLCSPGYYAIHLSSFPSRYYVIARIVPSWLHLPSFTRSRGDRCFCGDQILIIPFWIYILMSLHTPFSDEVSSLF
jgi:hypothetical protein